MEECHNSWDMKQTSTQEPSKLVVAKCPLHTPFHVCLAVIVPTLLSRLPMNLLASWPPNVAADMEDK